MKIELVEITPAKAEELLAHNTRNRNVREKAVNAYARDMRAGAWLQNGDAIRIATDGTLLDGQHRLLAIIQSGVTIPMYIASGLAPEAQLTMDTGINRPFHDVLALAGYPAASVLASVVRTVCMFEANGGSLPASGRRLTNTEMLSTLAKYKDTLEEGVRVGHALVKRTTMPRSVAGFCWWLFSAIDFDDAVAFFAAVESGEGRVGEPAFMLNRWLLRPSHDKLEGRNTRYISAITIRAWNAYRKGEEIQRLYWNAGGSKAMPFPQAI